MEQPRPTAAVKCCCPTLLAKSSRFRQLLWMNAVQLPGSLAALQSLQRCSQTAATDVHKREVEPAHLQHRFSSASVYAVGIQWGSTAGCGVVCTAPSNQCSPSAGVALIVVDTHTMRGIHHATPCCKAVLLRLQWLMPRCRGHVQRTSTAGTLFPGPEGCDCIVRQAGVKPASQWQRPVHCQARSARHAASGVEWARRQCSPSAQRLESTGITAPNQTTCSACLHFSQGLHPLPCTLQQPLIQPCSGLAASTGGYPALDVLHFPRFQAKES